MENNKCLVILGCTGTGKSDLALNLASIFNGEIVSADSMQIYKALPVATNQPSQEDLNTVPHHLVDVVSPSDNFNIFKYIEIAIPAIKDIHSKGKLPIIVGGTNLYIENLVFDTAINQSMEQSCEPSEDNEVDEIDMSEDKDKLYSELCQIDPERAAKLHPNDITRVKRSLEIYKKTGKKHTSFLQKNKYTERYDCCFIWLWSEKSVLYSRLDARVDQMMFKGLLKEVTDLFEMFLEKKIIHFQDEKIHLTDKAGIFQSIGFKEFLPYFASKVMNTTEENQQEVLSQCVDDVKKHTRWYATTQTKWVKNHFCYVSSKPLYSISTHCVQTGLPCMINMHKEGTSLLEVWQKNVLYPATKITENFLNDTLEKINGIPNCQIIHPKINENVWEKFECNICNKILNGTHEWKNHLKSKPHKKRQLSLKKRIHSKPIKI